jgi:anti-anti-sigma regulatory factor
MSSTPAAGGSDDRTIIVCEEVLDLSTVAGLHDRLRVAIAQGRDGHGDGDVVVQAHLIERIDTANLQLLCAAARELRVKGRALRLVDASAPLALAARRLGLTKALGLEPAAGSAPPAGATPPKPGTEPT